MKRGFLRPRRAPAQTSPTLSYTHARFLSLFGDRAVSSMTDGGPSDLNRNRKRAAGKRQRQARRIQRGR